MVQSFKSLTRTGKVIFLSASIVLLFFCFGGDLVVKTAQYILTHGDEINSFQPYTVEQAKADELKILGYNIK